MVLLQGLCYVVDITMVFLTFIGIFDFVFHLVELSRVDERGLLLPYSLTMNTPLRSIFHMNLQWVYNWIGIDGSAGTKVSNYGSAGSSLSCRIKLTTTTGGKVRSSLIPVFNMELSICIVGECMDKNHWYTAPSRIMIRVQSYGCQHDGPTLAL